MKLVYIVFRYVCLQRYCLERHKSNSVTYLIILAMLVFFPSKYCFFVFFFALWSNGEGNVNFLLYSWVENSMDRRARQATVHGIAKSQIQLCDYFNFQVHWHFWSILFALFTTTTNFTLLIITSSCKSCARKITIT